MKFNWDTKTLYKGKKGNLYIQMGLLVFLIGFGTWFSFGGSNVIWAILSKVLGL